MDKLRTLEGDDTTYALSIRLRHPSIEAGEISRALAASPNRQWTRGDKRTTPTGGPLNGLRDSTYWVHDPAATFGVQPSQRIRAHLASIQNAREFLKAFVETGGSIEYFLGWFVGSMSGDTFDSKLLAD